VSVKEVVFPFSKFPGVDIILGPEMRSTGEVMGIDRNFELAFAKSQIAAGTTLPTSGTVYISVRDADKPEAVRVARLLHEQGFEIIATGGTFAALQQAGINARRVNKIAEGRPNIVDEIKNGRIQLMINTPTKKGPKTDEGRIRAMSVTHRVPIFTTMTAAHAAARAIAALRRTDWTVCPLQHYHRG
jgi:carbamoyl-phosphate synthase large subunit